MHGMIEKPADNFHFSVFLTFVFLIVRLQEHIKHLEGIFEEHPKMILLAICTQLFEDYLLLLARVVTQIVQDAPFPRRVRQLILRRLNPLSAAGHRA
ncbi:hypothetical protein KP509_15G067700 [Ceratopteris richardii]|uniref:Uncharacterized protein n=2 Tax=Ceratopteris richardii TaxID=49495 RepID=A0A8T2T9A8_CERRI|nr:hypothetical protein KP509_15G067700 [Ceratopteris richardii]